MWANSGLRRSQSFLTALSRCRGRIIQILHQHHRIADIIANAILSRIKDGVNRIKPLVHRIVHSGLCVELIQDIVILMGGVGDLRQQSAEALIHGDIRIPAHLAPIGVVCPCGHTAILIGEIHHAAKAVGVDVGHIDAFLDALPPPVAAFANRHDLQLVQTVGVEEIVAVLLGLHLHPLVDVQSGIVNDIIRLDHFRLFDAGLHAGRLAVEVRIAVGIVLQNQLRADADAEAVEGIRADLAGLVGALHHAVRLVIEIGRNGDVLGSGGARRADLSSPNCPVLLSPKNCQQWNNC